jgi:hypothetical protein
MRLFFIPAKFEILQIIVNKHLIDICFILVDI